MPSMSPLTGKSLDYNLHEWGLGSRSNREAVERFKAWLVLRLEQALAVRVSGIVREMDDSSPGWKLVSPVVLANCSRVFSLG